jgi:DNA-binding IclR family transcriptional regulator
MTRDNAVGARQPKAIHSALTVLEEVARCGTGVTARDVSDNLGMPRATTYRLLNLLVQDEYLVRMPDLRGFALGHKVVELADRVIPAKPPLAAREILSEVRAHTRGAIHLVRYDRNRLTFIDADPDFPVSDAFRLTRFLETSALGRLLLAELDAVDAHDHREAEQYGLTREEAQEIRTNGYVRHEGTLEPSRGCIALAIRDSDGTLVAGLGFTGPVEKIRDPGATLQTLLSTTARLAPLLA